MKFTINIPVTRKRTKHGYYMCFDKTWRKFFLHRNDAIRTLTRVIKHTAGLARVVTARDYAKTTTNKPPT